MGTKPGQNTSPVQRFKGQIKICAIICEKKMMGLGVSGGDLWRGWGQLGPHCSHAYDQGMAVGRLPQFPAIQRSPLQSPF